MAGLSNILSNSSNKNGLNPFCSNMLKFVTLFFMLATASFSEAQFVKVIGTVADSSQSPIPLADIYIKNGQKIAETDNLGFYECKLLPGSYTLVFSHREYLPFQLNVTISNKPDTANVILQNEVLNIEAVQIYAKRIEMGPTYMREAIKMRNYWESKQANHSVDIYVKAFEDDIARKPEPAKPKKDDELDPEVRERKERERQAAAFMRDKAFAEVVLQRDFAQPNKVKEIRNGVKRAGDTRGLFYLSTLDGEFNFYNNLVRLPALNKLPVLSPLANTALLAYKFSFIGSFRDSTYGRILRITVEPRLTSNSTFNGEIQLIDTSFALYNIQLNFPPNQLNEYNEFSVSQSYNYYPDSQWTIAHQRFDYLTKAGKARYVGYTNVVYKNYEINRVFPKRHFGMELSATQAEAYKKDSSFWEQNRVVRLNPIETQFVEQSDSAKRARTSDKYLDSVENKNNKINIKSILIDGITYSKRKKGINLFFMPLVGVYQPWWPGGSRFAFVNSFRKKFESKRSINLTTNLSYGPNNNDLQGTVSFFTRYNAFKEGIIGATVGRQFDFINSQAAFLDLARRNNIYQHNHLSLFHSKEYFNGFTARVSASYSDRSDITDLKLSTSGLGDSIFDNNVRLPFADNRALYGTLNLTYTPRQKYIREPREKIVLGSHWPTFFANYTRAIPGVFNSNIDFEKISAGLLQEISFGMFGFSEYRLTAGTFLSKRNLSPVDYTFQRRGDPLIFTNPMYAFQTLDTTFPTFGRYLEGHYRHKFEGALINKIPFMKFLRLRESVGGSFLIAPERNNMVFAEVYAGADKIIRIRKFLFKVGLFYAVGYSNVFDKPQYGFKINLEFYDRVKNTW